MSQTGELRLLMTVDAVGGVWQYAIELAGALHAHGVSTVLAALGPAPSPEQRAEARATPGVTLVDTGLPLDWLCDGPAPVLSAGAAIADLARKHHADLIHLNTPTLAAAAPPGVPVVAATHGCVSTWWQAARAGEPLAAQFRWHRSLMSEGLRAADLVVAPTAHYARTAARHYSLRRTPVAVHNGRKPLTTNDKPPLHDRVLTVGRLWDHVKRAELLDRVAARLTVPFCAAGSPQGPHGETVRLDHLHLLGHVDAQALADHLAARPIFVSAACFEPFGLAVLEAAAAGCALVLSDIGPFRELWDGAALFVRDGDEDGYVAAIERLIGDVELRLTLGNAARERSARYTPEATAAAMFRLYTQLLDHPGAKAA